MKTTDEITNLTVAELSNEIRSRNLSAREITEAYLSRIEKCDSDINSYITVTRDIALSAADEADRRIRTNENAGEHRLAGIPFSVKDNINVKGTKTTCASKILSEFVSPYSASVFEKIEGVGGVLLGKTNLDEFAMGSSCEKSYFGAVKNPLDPARSPGGSSGGAAASVAARMAPWAIGTDTGGSTRQPASFCGLVSMKPTYGLVSRYGVAELASSLDTVSPITKTVYDNALVLSSMCGRDTRDMTSIEPDGDLLGEIGEEIKGLKIGLMKDYEGLCTEGMAGSLRRAAGILESLGAEVEYVTLPPSNISLDTYMVMTSAECSSNLARYDGVKYGYSSGGESYADIMIGSRSAGFGDEVKRRIVTGAFVLSSTLHGDYYRKVKAVQLRICKMIDEIFGKYDMVLTPTTSGKAFRLDKYAEDPVELYGSDIFTILANLTGCPAITLPCGGDGKMPYGAMLMGKKLSEAKLYRTAYALEDALKPYVKEEVRFV
ncbi:MAG: Asp-tRNA(Asn)/Glu-tRNA(Gln) amidotransferase subunit GatA [Ruminococcaceae bacterium]|nr:Asp-tRNA(Asn)/Glu-tRNA(Gln) amidotransferase subunit GatA [Oscillospiraceae bacterium]